METGSIYTIVAALGDLIKSDQLALSQLNQTSLVSQFMRIQYLIFSCLISALKTGSYPVSQVSGMT